MQIIEVILIILLVCVVIYLLIVYILPLTAFLGALLGGGIAISNYVRAFHKHVRPEGDPNGWLATAILIVFGLTIITVAGLAATNIINH